MSVTVSVKGTLVEVNSRMLATYSQTVTLVFKKETPLPPVINQRSLLKILTYNCTNV